MKVQYALQNVSFEWDSQKATSNFRKHKVRFELAAEAFFDPFVCYLDEEIVRGELREHRWNDNHLVIAPCRLYYAR